MSIHQDHIVVTVGDEGHETIEGVFSDSEVAAQVAQRVGGKLYHFTRHSSLADWQAERDVAAAWAQWEAISPTYRDLITVQLQANRIARGER